MIVVMDDKELANIVESINVAWGIKASLIEAGFSDFLPKAEDPRNGIISFPKRIKFIFLLFQMIQKGWESHNQLFYGNQLVNLNEMIFCALSINDTESADTLKQMYCEKLKDYLQIALMSNDLNYNLKNIMLFFLYHELTHVRIAQQPSFYEAKKTELWQRVNSAQPIIQKSMKKSLNKLIGLEEEVICDIEACKRLHETIDQTKFKETVSDIYHTLNIVNCISNLRDSYIRAKISMLRSYFRLTHSQKTKMSIARFTFIQNYWKGDLLLRGRDLLRDIFSTSLSLSLNNETIKFCKSEFNKEEEGFFNPEELRANEIKKEIYNMEDNFVGLVITKSNSL